jgi:uncharacterized Zn finger protein (UPF0148 family)
MSDFDKEAERERLREKYERDQAKREATEQMSELLLQGATMTNAHCSECGDPIFRYDGQEFCASCERAVDRAADDEAADDEATDEADAGNGEEADTDDEHIEVTSPSGAGVQFGGDAEADAPPESESQPADPPRQRRTIAEPDSAGSAGASPRQDRQREQRPGRSPGATPEGGDMAETRAALQRTLRRFAQRAEGTDDPREAEAYLSAAREAAETLSVLRR